MGGAAASPAPRAINSKVVAPKVQPPNKVVLKASSKKAKKKAAAARTYVVPRKEVNRGTARPISVIECIFCGEHYNSLHMQQHLMAAHREAVRQLEESKKPPKRVWVSIVSGGLPGLGKRR